MNGLHGIIFAYEKAPGLRELTEARMPGSVPFGGRYRVVDFMLSNMAGAGITDVGVVLHGNYQSLLDHIGSGKTWDMARKNGGLKLLPPFADARKFGVEEFRGKMEALSGVRSYLHEIRQKYVVLSDSDLIINLPLQKVLDAHIESGADITCVCTESGQFVENATYFTVNEAGRITETRCAPHKASGCRSLEIYLLRRDLLISLVDECAAQDKYSFRSDVLGGMGDQLDLRAFLWDGFAAQLRFGQGGGNAAGCIRNRIGVFFPVPGGQLHPAGPVGGIFFCEFRCLVDLHPCQQGLPGGVCNFVRLEI